MTIDKPVAIARHLLPWLVMLFVSMAHAAPGDPIDTTDRDGDGVPDEIETNAGFDPTFKDNDVFGDARLFVMQQYRDFLARESDEAGIDFWVGAMSPPSGSGQAPVQRTAMIQTFLDSAEFGGTVAPVARLYFAYFLRIPDYGGLNFWIGRHRSGDSLAAISDQFATSPEFVATYGSLDNAQFVQRVYSNVLARAPDSGGLAFWVGQMNAGMTRGQMMLQFSESPEYQALIRSEVYVTMIYSGMLRREPDSDGFRYWVDALDRGTSVQGLIDLFVGSGEYHNRFLQARPAGGAPRVVHTWPLDTAGNMSVLAPVTAMFSEPMNAATINSGTFMLSGPTGLVPATVSYASNSATLVPAARLLTEADYTGVITAGARDLDGNALAKSASFTFRTRAFEPPPIVAGCPTPADTSQLRRLEWGATPILRQKSGVVTSFRLQQSRMGRASVTFTQGQAAPSPPNPTIELTVSRCPGVIEDNLHPSCHVQTTFANFVNITGFNRALTEQGLYTQADHAALGCLAPADSAQYYVNMRWTFASCPLGDDQCGFSLQWGEGSY